MIFLKKASKYLLRAAINSLCFFISCFVPKSKKIVVIGGWFGKRFCDNSKALFLLLNNDCRFKKIIWISHSKEIVNQLKKQGFLAFYTYSIKSIWYHLRAKTHIVDQTPNDIFPYFSFFARKINLFHGLPIKKVGIYSENKKISKLSIAVSKTSIFNPGAWNKCYYLASSDYTADIFSKSFLLRKNHIIKCSYPRDYWLHFPDYSLKSPLFIEGKRIIFYFPTFRKKEKDIINFDFFKKINDFCEATNSLVFYKLHFADYLKDYSFKGLANIVILDKDFDINEILFFGDILITDYSSVCWDFAILKKPILFFPYDYNDYAKEDRGFYREYLDNLFGDHAFDIENLLLSLEDIIKYPDQYSEKYDLKYESELKFMNEFYKKFDIEPLILKILGTKSK